MNILHPALSSLSHSLTLALCFVCSVSPSQSLPLSLSPSHTSVSQHTLPHHPHTLPYHPHTLLYHSTHFCITTHTRLYHTTHTSTPPPHTAEAPCLIISILPSSTPGTHTHTHTHTH